MKDKKPTVTSPSNNFTVAAARIFTYADTLSAYDLMMLVQKQLASNELMSNDHILRSLVQSFSSFTRRTSFEFCNDSMFVICFA